MLGQHELMVRKQSLQGVPKLFEFLVALGDNRPGRISEDSRIGQHYNVASA
jgi:hypothetical protein